MVSSQSINGNVDMTENEITPETLDSIIIEAINTIRRNKKDPMNYIFEYLNKELHNSSITSTLIDTRLSTLKAHSKN